jgi:hypothetical protein
MYINNDRIQNEIEVTQFFHLYPKYFSRIDKYIRIDQANHLYT